MRIGSGFDVHALVDGRKLVHGGVTIDWIKGLDGHSDADVLIHAICDALLGAAGLGDIGKHYPPSNPEYKDIDSRKLLKGISQLVADCGLAISNLDATIIAEAPRMAPHIPAMVANIAGDLRMSESRVNIKATTTEKLGCIGRGEGIAAQAVVLLNESDRNPLFKPADD